MKFAILSVVAAGALALSAGVADAHPPGYRGGYNHGHYHGYRGGYSYGHYPHGYAYPSYGYGSSFGLTIGGPHGVINIGSGSVVPGYGYRSYYGNPYSGWSGYGYPWRW